MNALASGSASIACSPSNYPVVSVTYSPDRDAGVPGLFFVGVLAQGGQSGGVLTAGNRWVGYEGGSFPFYEKYLTGIPGSISFSIGLPNGSMTTEAYVGYTLYAGHGVYTKKAAAEVAKMIKDRDETKASLIKYGAWTADLEKGWISDIQMIQAAVEHDFYQNQKGVKLLTIPYLDCTPPPPEKSISVRGSPTSGAIQKPLTEAEKAKCVEAQQKVYDALEFLKCLRTPGYY